MGVMQVHFRLITLSITCIILVISILNLNNGQKQGFFRHLLLFICITTLYNHHKYMVFNALNMAICYQFQVFTNVYPLGLIVDLVALYYVTLRRIVSCYNCNILLMWNITINILMIYYICIQYSGLTILRIDILLSSDSCFLLLPE